jgi:hypothetical protein
VHTKPSDLLPACVAAGPSPALPTYGEAVDLFDIRFVVTDDGAPPESASQLFSLVVGEPAAAELQIREAVWQARRGMLRVSGRGAESRASVELRDAASGSVLDTTTADRRGRFRFRLRMRGSLAPCAVEAVSGAGGSGSVDVAGAPSGCAPAGGLLPQSRGAPGRAVGAPEGESDDEREGEEREIDAEEAEEDSALRWRSLPDWARGDER